MEKFQIVQHTLISQYNRKDFIYIYKINELKDMTNIC